MFLRVVRAAGGKGVKHEYVRVVEAFRQKGKTRHRTVLNLGRRDLLAAHLDLDKLMKLLHGEAGGDGVVHDKVSVRSEDVKAVAALDWGPMLVARHLWQELGLQATIDRLVRPGRRDIARASDCALVLVANRLAAPTSEHGLARWLETDFVCDRNGRQWVPAWRDDSKRKMSRTPRVRVEARQLQQWYRTLDQLLKHKNEIEHALYLTLRDKGCDRFHILAANADFVVYHAVAAGLAVQQLHQLVEVEMCRKQVTASEIEDGAMACLAFLTKGFDHAHVFVLDAFATGGADHAQEHGLLQHLSLPMET